MNPEDIKQHWKDCADEHGTDVHATTPASTAKQLEIAALWRRLDAMQFPPDVLEAGCGNGLNCIELAKRLPACHFDGFDYLLEMIQAANKGAAEAGVLERTRFMVGDILAIDKIPGIQRYDYDVVITDRCIINLDTWDKQKQAIAALAGKVRPGGWLLMIENCKQRRNLQSEMRELLGLEPRGFPPFNLFLDEDKIFNYLNDIGLHLIEWEHFCSLHDLCLYILGPALGERHGYRLSTSADETINYDSPLVKIATELSLKTPGANFGAFGQNTLFVCRKPA